ncbi:zona pellucida sperm-binding protein 3-like [Pelmatolapia mariae]|uniref:zona pellucida sperm-binding protein 3-like n=1 Tax=Pelmatolapia mariae TaxID=158779 RepID=UPI002FE56FE7
MYFPPQPLKKLFKALQMQCGENKVRIAEKHQFSQDRRIPFSPQCFQLGENLSQESSCRPKEAVSEAEMVISAGLRECGTEKQKVSREPLSLTWVPMTSTVSVFGLQHFSLHIMADVCTSQCGSTVYQQGEAVLLEARVEALMHPPVTVYVDSCVATLKPHPLSLHSYRFITNHTCLMDSLLPDSPSTFYHSSIQMFISCHLMATLKQSLHSKLEKTCFFHRPIFSFLSCGAPEE